MSAEEVKQVVEVDPSCERDLRLKTQRAKALEPLIVCGAKLNPSSIVELVDAVDDAIRSKEQTIVAAQNLHCLYVMHREPAIAELHHLKETIVHIDGMPLIAIARLRGHRIRRSDRITMLDWIWPLLDRADERKWKVFFLGGAPNMSQPLRQLLAARYPELEFNCEHGYFSHRKDELENRAVLDTLKIFKPDLLLIGMGMGAQEKWILDNMKELSPTSICIVGGCFEYLTGQVRTPPRWSGQLGLEWAFRFVDKPGRFWFRYLIEPLWLASHYAKKLLVRRFGFSGRSA